MENKKLILTTGFGIFAFFFGAGNLIFPIYLGAITGTHIKSSIVIFLIIEMLIPLTGLISMFLYEGDFIKAFSYLGKTITLVIMGLIVSMLGPIISIPRCIALIVSLSPSYIPVISSHSILLSIIIGLMIFLVLLRHNNLFEIIGKYLAPLKFIAIGAIIVLGYYSAGHIIPARNPLSEDLKTSVNLAYNTLDLLASVFFAKLFYNYIEKRVSLKGKLKHRILKYAIFSSFFGWGILSVIYVNLAFVSAFHADALRDANITNIINLLADNIFGWNGGLIIFMAISLACFVTATALTKIFTDFISQYIFKDKIPYNYILLITILLSLLIGNLGLLQIVEFSTKFLQFIYPVVIVLMVFNILRWIYARSRISQKPR